MFEIEDDDPCSRQLKWMTMPDNRLVITNLQGFFEVCEDSEVSVWSSGVRFADEGGWL